MMKKSGLLAISFLIFCLLAINLSAFKSTDYFPLGAEMAEGYDMPLPMGFGFTYYFQDQDYKLAKFHVNMPGVPEGIEDEIEITNYTSEANVKLDVWVLPFANIFFLGGKVTGDTDFKLDEFFPIRETINYEGIVYGAGLTLAAGYKSLFATLNTTYTKTNLDLTDSDVDAWIISPKVGVNFPSPFLVKDIAIWTGSMYQEYEEHHEGTWTLEDINGNEFDVDYDVELAEGNAWNYLTGVAFGISRRFSLEFEAGFGDRTQLASSLTYRF